jgi:Protein of unknown function (DUF4089)
MADVTADSVQLAQFVREAAATAGLTIAPEGFPDVVTQFAVLARVAAPLMKFGLAEDVVAAAVFVPDDVSRR